MQKRGNDNLILDHPDGPGDDSQGSRLSLGDHFAQERLAGVKFAERAEFVRLVRLVDGAGAADHGRNAVALELARLGAIGDRFDRGWRRSVRAPARRRANPRPSPGRDRRRAVRCRTPPRRRGARYFGRISSARAALHRLHDRLRIAVGQGAIFPGHQRLARQDVHRRAAGDHGRPARWNGADRNADRRRRASSSQTSSSSATNSPAIITALAPFSGALEWSFAAVAVRDAAPRRPCARPPPSSGSARR